ncbi:MAG: acrA 3 [Myxococcaceae bacterium]|nr:acrA 3 [Myxococcaceae bacterium]
MKRRALGWWVAALVAAGSAGGCHHAHHHAEARPRFEVTTVVKQDVEITRPYVCQIRSIQHIELRALEGGYLRDVFVDEGQMVHRGQALFQITPVLYQAELARTSAEVQHAQVEFQNTQLLRQGNVVSPNELALAQATLNQASAQRQVAQAHLRFSRLEAPFDGIIGRLMARRGSLLEEGDLLTVLADNSEMWVYFNVSEPEYLAYRRSHALGEQVPVRLRMANNEIYEHPGVIQTIEADFNNETGTIAFRAGFPNREGLLRHGETGEILMTSSLPRALIIPQKATYTVLDKTFVFVVGADDVVRAREITTGESMPHQYVVTNGLREGERILIEGLRRVRDGDTIVPNVRDPRQVFDELSHLMAE